MLKHLKTLSGHQNPVYALANADVEGMFFSAGNDKGVVEWSLKEMAFAKVKMPVQSSVYALHVQDHQLFIGERSGAFTIYDLSEEKVIIRINAHTKPIFDIKTVKSKNELITTGEDGTVAVWSLIDFTEIYRFQAAYDTIRVIAISPDETEIAFGCKDHLIRIYNLSDYSVKQSLEAHTFAVTSMAYEPNGKYLISGSRDAQLKIWDLPNYELSQNVPAHLFSIYSIIFHPYLPYFATCSQDKSIKLWDAENFKLYKNLSLEKTDKGHSHSINKMIWSDDGKYLISTGDDRKVMIWELTLI
ncbi:WD40 repeat domain-containing protein [Pedobacter insulae]|uniref:WD domain-containing protein, G-beta repeat-containing protein n=1 Tax=Pedobacter insulae TaxID=414048 RepID=A0A1I2VL19_9SPHI|nr:WD40 repeat domain-containing protein [Pedobacter insulae]SFG89830.1 WD domain-containing protein, G-beta repeat-containing protein [Pedobacter insulae]